MADSQTFQAYLNALLDRIEETIDLYSVLTATKIPTTAKEALAASFVVSADAIQLGVEYAYLPHLQKEDSRRAISLARAVEILRDFQDDLADNIIPQGTHIGHFMQSLPGAAHSFMEAFAQFFHDALADEATAAGADEVDWFPQVIQLAEWVIAAYTAKEMKGITEKAFWVAWRYESFLRKKALPQRKGKRYRVRKKARR